MCATLNLSCTTLRLSSVENLLEKCTNNNELYSKINTTYNKYKTRDMFFMYFVSLALLINSLCVIISLDNSDCSQTNAKNNVVKNECVFLSTFAIILMALRVYFFKLYLQLPIIANWNLGEATFIEKILNIVFVLLGLGCFAVYVVMYSSISNNNYTLGIIFTCVVCVLSLLTSAWYKLIVYHNIANAVDKQTTVSQNTTIQIAQRV